MDVQMTFASNRGLSQFVPSGLLVEGGSTPATGADTAAVLKDPLANAVEAVRLGSSGDVDAASLGLKKMMMEHIRSSETSLAAMNADPSKAARHKEPFAPLQQEFHQSVLRASFAACAAGALDGVQAYVAGLAPRAVPVSDQDSMASFQITKDLHERSMWVLPQAEGLHTKGDAEQQYLYGVEFQQQYIEGAASATPSRTASNSLMWGHVNEVVRGSYDAGVKLGLAAAAGYQA